MAIDTLDIIRENLRRRIMDDYHSFERFAYENAIDKTTLSRLLNGKREPKVSTLLKIAQSLNLTLNDLYLTPGNHIREKSPAYAVKSGKKIKKRKVTLWLSESDIAMLQEKLKSAGPVSLEIKIS